MSVISHAEMKLGKLAPKEDTRTLMLAPYLNSELPPPPPSKTYWEYRIDHWRMLLNNLIGDCTCASAGHMIMNWTAHGKGEFIPNDQQIVEAYSEVSGYDTVTGKNDNGAFCLDVLNHWRKKGIANRKIEAYVKLDPQNIEQVKQAIYLFGGVYVGAALPISASKQIVWRVEREDGGPWGGHCISVHGYGRAGATCVTWGDLKQLTWDWWRLYVDEAYAILSTDWLDANEVSPSHFDFATLSKDLKAIGD